MRLLLFLMMVCLSATDADAKLKVLGKGERMRFDSAGFPANMKPGYDVMNTKCKACHSLERVVLAITSGIAPVTGQPFDKMATKSYGIKMLRKPNSNMSRDDIKTIIGFMNFLLDESVKP
ncbi:MAG: cytochrome C [Geobacteraceae bacterium]|nr:cytochrome C [Geobacteraceae bacterium]NTW79811.1 cytochrome C [Geobacteraceae bacterium]